MPSMAGPTGQQHLPRVWRARGSLGGFTVVELMVTLAVAAVLIAAGIPSLTAMIQNNQLAAASNALVTAVQLARSEAVRRGRPVTVCSSADGSSCRNASTGWAGQRWLVFQDAAGAGAPATSGSGFELIRVFPALEGDLVLTSPQPWLRFAPGGSVSPAGAGAEQSFVLRPGDCEGDAQRSIQLSRLGRVRTQRVACS